MNRRWTWDLGSHGVDKDITMLKASLALFALSLATFVTLLETSAVAEVSRATYNVNNSSLAERRREIKSMDIHERPNRPIHVYGNTVRRRSSRG